MNVDYIEYDDGLYPVRIAYLFDGTEEVRVSVERLEDALLKEVDDPDSDQIFEPKDDDAKAIDDSIYCYVPSDVMELEQSEFDRYIEENFT